MSLLLPQLPSSDQGPIKNSCGGSLSSHALASLCWRPGPTPSDLSDMLCVGPIPAPLSPPSVDSLGAGWNALGCWVESVWPDVFPSWRVYILGWPRQGLSHVFWRAWQWAWLKTFKELHSIQGKRRLQRLTHSLKACLLSPYVPASWLSSGDSVGGRVRNGSFPPETD